MKKNIFLFWCILFLSTSTNCYSTKLTLSQIKKLQPSIVRVITTDTKKIGSGFIYSNIKYIVTAFHVISGSNGNVIVKYESLNLVRYGTVIKTLKSADLALIEITNPVNQPVLIGSTANVNYNSEYTAIGFLWDAENYFSIDVTKKETRDLNFLPSSTVNDIKLNGCPSLTLNVFSFAGNPLVPGYSGSPIFDSDERVIAIGDGGIKEGLASVSWGIPVSNLNDLFRSNQNIKGPIVLTHSLFAADNIQSLNWEMDTLIVNNEKFNKTRTEKLQSIASSTDDVNGLNMILNTFPVQIDKNNIEFDVYQNFSNGAIFILPTGYSFTKLGNTIALQSTNGQVFFSIDIEKCTFYQMNALTIQLENNQLVPLSGWYWYINPSFTYIYPFTRSDGFIVKRAAFVQSFYNQAQNFTYFNNYLFESFVYKNNLLMYLNVKNFDYNTTYLQSRLPCEQNGYSDVSCKSKLSELTEWMKMVISVHFATFAN